MRVLAYCKPPTQIEIYQNDHSDSATAHDHRLDSAAVSPVGYARHPAGNRRKAEAGTQGPPRPHRPMWPDIPPSVSTLARCAEAGAAPLWWIAHSFQQWPLAPMEPVRHARGIALGPGQRPQCHRVARTQDVSRDHPVKFGPLVGPRTIARVPAPRCAREPSQSSDSPESHPSALPGDSTAPPMPRSSGACPEAGRSGSARLPCTKHAAA